MNVLSDYVLGFYDGPHATPKEADEGPIFLGIKNVTPDGRLDFSEIRHVSEQEFARWTKRVKPQFGDVVFSYEATLHRYALIPEGFEGCLGRRMALIRPDPTKLDARFLHFYLLSPRWRNQVDANVITGATVNRLPLTKVPSFAVDFPDLLNQQRIATILSAYDDLIENNRRRIALLEEAARQLYKEWFVRFRFPGHEHVKIIDGVPEGWERKTLRDVATLNYGKALKEETRIPGGVPVFGSSGIVGSHNKALVNGPGIILGRKGNVGSVRWSHCNFFPIDTVYFIASDQSDFHLYLTLQHMQFMSTDVAVPGLNREFAYSRSLIRPSATIGARFEEEVTPVFLQIQKLTEWNEKLANARDLLLPKLMNGAIAA